MHQAVTRRQGPVQRQAEVDHSRATLRPHLSLSNSTRLPSRSPGMGSVYTWICGRLIPARDWICPRWTLPTWLVQDPRTGLEFYGWAFSNEKANSTIVRFSWKCCDVASQQVSDPTFCPPQVVVTQHAIQQQYHRLASVSFTMKIGFIRPVGAEW